MGQYVASVPSGSLNQASTVTFKLGPGTEDVAPVKSREGRKTRRRRRSAAVAMAEEIILGLAGGGEGMWWSRIDVVQRKVKLFLSRLVFQPKCC